MAELFGFEIKRKNQEDLGSFVNKQEDDGAVVVAEGGAYGQRGDGDARKLLRHLSEITTKEASK